MHLYPKIEKELYIYNVCIYVCISKTKMQSSKTIMFKFSKKIMREDLKLTRCKIAICACNCCPVR